MDKKILELHTVKTKIENEIALKKADLTQIEGDLSDKKLNPYGITNIDFSKRMEVMEDITKMEGCIMGIDLCIETMEEKPVAEDA
jgi:hypothetical protein